MFLRNFAEFGQIQHIWSGSGTTED